MGAGDEEQQGSLKEVPELRPLHIDPSANQLRPPRSMVMTLQVTPLTAVLCSSS